MLPYSAAAVYANQLQQVAMSYHGQQGQQRPSSPSASLQLAATLNLERLRCGLPIMQPNGGCAGVVGPNQAQAGSPMAGTGYHPTIFHHPAAFDPMALAAAGFRHAFDPRTGRLLPPEEPKPQHSYIGLIAMAILSNTDKKMVLSDIYQWILDHYPYFRTRGPGWRNSIRHNLSLNDCFIKSGRSANGKGHYWAIHPANVEDFKKGDFRRRRAQRKVRKHMGLSVPDDEDDSDDSPCSSPPVGGNNFFLTTNGSLAGSTASTHASILPPLHPIHPPVPQNLITPKPPSFLIDTRSDTDRTGLEEGGKIENKQTQEQQQAPNKRKRLFDMESLLSPARSDEKRENGENDGSKSEDRASDGAGATEKSTSVLFGYQRPQQGPPIPNPFFFPPPIPSGAPGNENGHLLAAMAAAAAGFMPFAFLPNAASHGGPSLPWNFGTPTGVGYPNGQSQGTSFFPSVYPSWPINGVPTTSTSVSPASSKAVSNISPDCGTGENGTTEVMESNQQMRQSLEGCDQGNHGGTMTRTPSPQDTAAQWQETFAKIMARSYQGRQMVKNKSSNQTDGEEEETEERRSKSPKMIHQGK